MTSLPWQEVSLPPEDSVTAPWWSATRERRLVLQTCGACSAVQHPPRPLCVTCSSTDLAWVEAAGRATVDAFSVIHRAPDPALDVPYVIARVRLVEGPVLLARIEGADLTADQPLRCDQDVRLGWAPLPDGRALPTFSVQPSTHEEH